MYMQTNGGIMRIRAKDKHNSMWSKIIFISRSQKPKPNWILTTTSTTTTTITTCGNTIQKNQSHSQRAAKIAKIATFFGDMKKPTT